ANGFASRADGMTVKHAAIFEGQQSRNRHTVTAFWMQQSPQAAGLLACGAWKGKDQGGLK
ncbi:MAG TPA: hypothetical protein VGU23_02615, partial [Acidobacteriaceae bacterium]|nr:hypothetical protein [Acidobacteriaceae bacterium]